MKYACPKCKSTDLRVEVTVVRELFQNRGPEGQFSGTRAIDGCLDHWDNVSMMLCHACDFTSEAVDFEVGDAAPPGSR